MAILIFVKEVLTHLRTIADQDKRESGQPPEVAAGGRRRQSRRLHSNSWREKGIARVSSPIGNFPVESARSSVPPPPRHGGMAVPRPARGCQ